MRCIRPFLGKNDDVCFFNTFLHVRVCKKLKITILKKYELFCVIPRRFCTYLKTFLFFPRTIVFSKSITRIT